MNETEQDQQSLEKINIPIEWHVSDSIRSQYVTNVVVQAGQAVRFPDPVDQKVWEAYKAIEPLYSDANRRLAQ